MNVGLVKRRQAALALASAAALTGGMLGLSGPALAAGNHTVTIVTSGADANGLGGLGTELTCYTGADGTGTETYDSFRDTDANGQAAYHNVPDSGSCEADVFGGREYDSNSVTSGGVTSDVSINVPLTPSAFRCTHPSSVSGSPIVGQTVSAVLPTGSFTQAVDSDGLRYDWYRLGVVNGHFAYTLLQSSEPSTNRGTYTLTQADYGSQIEVDISATSATETTPGSGDYPSATCDYTPSAMVDQPGTPTSGRPAIRGAAKVGHKLRANYGTPPAGTSVAGYQWYYEKVVKRGHGKVVLVKIKGAKHRVYKVGKALKGKRILVAVTYTRPLYNATTVLSKPKRVK